MDKLLLLGNSKNRTQPYLGHAEAAIKEFLGDRINRVLFIPYARVLPSFDVFASTAGDSFQRMGYQLSSIHWSVDPHKAIKDAQAIVVGGGNTFHLLHELYERRLLSTIRERVNSGTPYVGWSAGANVACPTIKTTNDMPILEPESFTALGLVPFQINPHYVDCSNDHTTETREERIAEFIEVNSDVYVVGLREGSFLRVHGSNIELFGDLGARIFIKGREPVDYENGKSLPFLLQNQTELCPVT